MSQRRLRVCDGERVLPESALLRSLLDLRPDRNRLGIWIGLVLTELN
jgi:hypothetical protein